MKRIIINGFGRIGKCIFRLLLEKYDDIEVVQINEPNASIDCIMYSIKYDSVYGYANYHLSKDTASNTIIVSYSNKKWKVKISSEINPCFHDTYDTTIIDSSNNCNTDIFIKNNHLFSEIFLTRWNRQAYKTHLYDNNYLLRSKKNNLISCGICDTIGIVPVLSLFDITDIANVSITTLHPFLNYQNLLDGYSREIPNLNYQIGRSALNTVIPKKSSVQDILCEIFPTLENSLTFMTYRIPTELVTTCDMEIIFKNCISESIIRDLILNNKNNIHYTNDMVISRDFIHSTFPAIIDLNWLSIKNNKLHLTFYYNNELGYADSICKIIS